MNDIDANFHYMVKNPRWQPLRMPKRWRSVYKALCAQYPKATFSQRTRLFSRAYNRGIAI